MNDNITLQRLPYNEEKAILDIINSDYILRKTFIGMDNTISRIINSSYIGLIKKDTTTIGFIMLVYNCLNNNHELDIGIMSDYRYQGYGTKALSIMKEIITKENADIIIQVKKENVPATKMIENNNFNLVAHDNRFSYYSNNKVLKK